MDGFFFFFFTKFSSPFFIPIMGRVQATLRYHILRRGQKFRIFVLLLLLLFFIKEKSLVFPWEREEKVGKGEQGTVTKEREGKGGWSMVVRSYLGGVFLRQERQLRMIENVSRIKVDLRSRIEALFSFFFSSSFSFSLAVSLPSLLCSY